MTRQLSQERREARRALGAELRRLRELAGLSGEQVAEAAHLSQSTVSRIESGDRRVDLTQVHAWVEIAAQALGDAGRGAVDMARLEDLADRAVSGVVPLEESAAVWQEKVRELETKARVVTNFQPGMVPGLLQTAEYARRILAARPNPGNLETAVAKRMQRQEILYDPFRSFLFVMTEAALRWRPGPGDPRASQLEKIASIATLGNVEVEVIPLDAEMTGGAPPAFILHESEDGEGVASVEAPAQGLETTDIQPYRSRLDLLRRSALSGDEAVAFIRGLARRIAP
jgi:transcriptional regulator with XRE-family HTH domain